MIGGAAAIGRQIEQCPDAAKFEHVDGGFILIGHILAHFAFPKQADTVSGFAAHDQCADEMTEAALQMEVTDKAGVGDFEAVYRAPAVMLGEAFHFRAIGFRYDGKFGSGA